jgi:hypothetical protein
MKLIVTSLASATVVLACHTALAQNAGNGGATYSNLAGAENQVADLLPNFVSNAQSVLSAQVSLFGVVGASAQADGANAQSKKLSPDADRATFESVVKYLEDSGSVMEKQLSGTAALDDGRKKQVADATAALAKVVTQFAAMSKETADMRKGPRKPGTAMPPALFVAKSLPYAVKYVGQGLKAAVAFSKSNGIPVAPEANEALSTL